MARLCSEAVHYSFSLGLHVKEIEWKPKTETLLCCVWIVDKFVALTTGRPTRLKKSDLSHEGYISECFALQADSFRALGLLSEHIDKCLAKNFDQSDSADGSFPTFESLILSVGMGHMEPGVFGKYDPVH
jgi:hypothetical protein